MVLEPKGNRKMHICPIWAVWSKNTSQSQYVFPIWYDWIMKRLARSLGRSSPGVHTVNNSVQWKTLFCHCSISDICNARRLYSKLVCLWGHLVFLIQPATHKTGFVLTERCRLSDLIHLRLSETCNHVYYKLVSKRCTKGSSINSPAPWVTYTYGNTAFSINKDAQASIYKINVVMLDNEMDK